MRPLSGKNFSTAAIRTVLTIWGLVALAQGAAAQTPPSQPMPGMAQAAVTKDVFVTSAPDRYTVVRGDTLWGIAKRFLKNPLQWPSIWRMNRAQIKNPHWIYPGQVIIIDRVNGLMYLEGQGRNGPNGTIRVEPEVRVETSEQAIPSIPQDIIEPFLSQPLVVDSATMSASPRIIGSKNDHVILSRGDTAYVAGITDPNVTSYQIYRPGTELKDPETGKVIAYQAEYLGAAQVTRAGNPTTVVVTSFTEEIVPGDRLVPSSQPALINFVPHAPENPVKGSIVTTLGHTGYAGKDMVVVLNRGSSDGLEIGNVLAVQTAGREITDKSNGSSETFRLPNERNGLIFVFRVFDHISYALVLEADIEMQAGDIFTQP